jgi:rhamnose transport system ATP-binding protein
VDSPAKHAAPVLVAEGLHKRYDGAQALGGATMALYAGEIHGLCGENGSGKSTLLKIVSAQISADQGRVVLDGRVTRFGDASQALQAGIATVTQERALVDDLSVAENIFLGPRKPRSWYGVDWRETRRRARTLLDSLGCSIDLDAPVGRLRPDLQQMVEIARALSTDARVLILDEPTSSLADDEVESLFAAFRALKGSGVATVFVSHRLREVFALCDRLTVLRDGEVVGSGPVDDFDERRLVSLMLGRELDALSLEDRRQDHLEGAVLRVRGLGVPGRLDGLSFDVGPGEVVGLAGLVGAGRSDLLGALFGLEPGMTGTVEVDGRPVLPRTPAHAMAAGFGFVPADRKAHGLVLDMTLRENLLMARDSQKARLARPSRGADRRATTDAARAFHITAGSHDAAVSRLSGGNQQKVVLAKWFATEPRVMLLDEPTRGVDVGSKAEIYRLLEEAKERGLAILVSSSETSELLLLCDRVLVMARGRITASFDRDEADEALIARAAMEVGG